MSDDRMARAAEMMARGGIGPVDLSDKEPAAQQQEIPITRANGLFSGDPTLPLENTKHEAFVRAYLASRNASIAYRTAISPQCRMDTAAQQASRVMKRAEVRARLRYLLLQEKAETADPVPGRVMGLPVKLAELERIIRTGTPSDRVRAIQEHNRLTGHGRPTTANVPDPAFLAEFLRRAEDLGLDPVQAAKTPTEGDGQAAHDVPASGDLEPVLDGGDEVWEDGGK